MLVTEFIIVINCAVADPIHVKDLIDGLNACKKIYLKQMMMKIILTGDEEALREKKIISKRLKESEFANIVG